jgi:hypothetical protein
MIRRSCGVNSAFKATSPSSLGKMSSWMSARVTSPGYLPPDPVGKWNRADLP